MKPVISFILLLFVVAGIPQGISAQTTIEEGALTLSTAIDQTLENATNIRIAKSHSDGVKASSGLLSSDYIPKISSSLSYSLSQYPQIVTPIRQQGLFPPLDEQIFEANIQADWEIFDFGESRAIRQKAKSLADAANIKYELARMETIESTSSAFIQLQQLRELLRVQVKRIDALKVNKKQLESLHREGRIAKVDLLKIEDVILEAETAVVTTQNNIDQILQRLSDDLSIDQELTMDDIAPLIFKNDYLFDPDYAAVGKAPSVKVARAQKQASDYEAKASYRAFLPQFNLFATEQFRSGSDFEIDDQWIIGARLKIPLFAGKKVVNRQVKKIEVKSQQVKVEQTRQQYHQQLNKLTNAQHETQKRIQALETRITYLEETYRVETSSYREGRTILTDLLTTESKLNSVRAELLAMRAQLRMLNLNIAVLTGQLNKDIAIKLAKGEPL